LRLNCGNFCFVICCDSLSLCCPLNNLHAVRGACPQDIRNIAGATQTKSAFPSGASAAPTEPEANAGIVCIAQYTWVKNNCRLGCSLLPAGYGVKPNKGLKMLGYPAVSRLRRLRDSNARCYNGEEECGLGVSPAAGCA